MKCLAATIFLVGGFRDDQAAQQLFRTFQESLEKARTLHAEFSLTVEAGGEVDWTLSGDVKLKGGDRWAIDLKYHGKPRRDGPRSVVTSLFCDGRIPAAGDAPRELVLDSLKPLEVCREIRSTLATGLVPLMYFVRPGEDKRPGRIAKLPVIEGIRDGGEDTVGVRDARIIEYTAKVDLGWEYVFAARLWLDATTKAPLRRELVCDSMKVTEVFAGFSLDVDLPDSDLSFQSKRRLSRAQAWQLARSVELFGSFTGRHPQSLEELTRRPASLDADIFWPEGGFVLGGALPRDPWGRPFELRRERGHVMVIGLGANGKIGGRGDDEDAAFEVPPVALQPVGAPSERLRRQYAARVQLHLLAAAVRTYRKAYGDLPEGKASLLERPESARVWPDGGWLPGGLPLDPWGHPYRLIVDFDQAIVQVRDPKSTALGLTDLTDGERSGQDAVSRRRLSADDRKSLEGLLDRLRADEPDVRAAAMDELRAWGSAIIPELDDRVKTEKDSEASLRLAAIQRGVRALPAAARWSSEITPLALTIRRREAPDNDLLDQCESRLLQVWRLQRIYAFQFGGKDEKFPNGQGKEFWLALSRTRPALAAASVFRCPTRTDESVYLGPARDVNALGNDDVVALCEEEAHGGHVLILRKSGEVLAARRDSPDHEVARKEVMR